MIVFSGRTFQGKTFWLSLAGLAVSVAVLSLFCGRYGLAPLSVVKAVLGLAEKNMDANIVLSVRLPRIILTLLVGAGLAVSGAAFQGVFQNPLVSPDVLSVSSGAAFGAVLGIMLDTGESALIAMALAMGCLSVFLTYTGAKVQGKVSVLSLVLSGIIMSALFNALISLMKYVADTETQLPAITYWLLGSFAATTYKHVLIVVLPILLGTAVLLAMGHKINILSLGDEEANSLGIDPYWTRIGIIIAATLVTASCITVTGIIGWVGLVIPHIARLLVGPNHSRLLPASVLLGAMFMTLMDLLARTLLATEIPVGVLTALVGAPFFMFLFHRQAGM
ncbi:MAG: iron ABC transporter permease [Mailhella sp.]|nr:iron ABC transporter permease [Mailhella sp.]